MPYHYWIKEKPARTKEKNSSAVVNSAWSRAIQHAVKISTPTKTFSTWHIEHFPNKRQSLKIAIYQDNVTWKEMRQLIIRQSLTAKGQILLYVFLIRNTVLRLFAKVLTAPLKCPNLRWDIAELKDQIPKGLVWSSGIM